ncbi:MAG: hypothetical protein MUO60_08975 [Clostridiaceae bacterium]|nr:hypothetical protein [Clostridiaceae bacterium]
MKNKVFENRLREKIKSEGTDFPPKLDEKIKFVISKLPERQKKVLLWARYGKLAVSLALFLCISIVGITSFNLNGDSLKKNTEYKVDNDIQVNKISDNSVIENLKAEGYVVENDSEKERNMKIVSSTANSTKLYRSLEELVKESDMIIEGEVLGISYFDNNTATWTKSKVKVIKSYNNKAKEGDILTFVEAGGITTQYNIIKYNHIDEKFNMSNEEIEKAKSLKVKTLFQDAPYMQPNEKVFLFSKDETDFFGSTTEKYYAILGCYQGKFTILGETAERYMQQGYGDVFPSLKMSKKDMDKRIDEIIGNM